MWKYFLYGAVALIAFVGICAGIAGIVIKKPKKSKKQGGPNGL